MKRPSVDKIDENQNNILEEEQKLLNENELTHYYCAHCVYATKRKFNIERKHAHKEMIICCNNEKSHMEFIPVDEKDDLLEDSIEVWKIYQLLLKMKNK